MKITSAQYQKNKDNDENVSVYAVIDEKEISVPIDMDNRHYVAILEWAKEDGNEIQAAE